MGFVITKSIVLQSIEIIANVLVAFVLEMHILWTLSLLNELCFDLFNFNIIFL